MIDYNQIAAHYVRHRRVHPGVLQQLLSTGNLTSTARVLEVGCGTGNYIVGLESVIDCHCWGLEPAAEMLAQAQSRSPTITFQAGRAEQLDYQPDFFNLVFSVDVIHHVANHAAYFQEAYRILKNGGRLCTVTDSEEIIRHRQPLSVYFPETAEIDLQRYPRIEALRRLMTQTGFGRLTEQTVALNYQLTDIQIYRDRAFSALHLMSDRAFQQGLARMAHDLQAGPIRGVSRYLLLWGEKNRETE